MTITIPHLVQDPTTLSVNGIFYTVREGETYDLPTDVCEVIQSLAKTVSPNPAPYSDPIAPVTLIVKDDTPISEIEAAYNAGKNIYYVHEFTDPVTSEAVAEVRLSLTSIAVSKVNGEAYFSVVDVYNDGTDTAHTLYSATVSESRGKRTWTYDIFELEAEAEADLTGSE